MPSRFASLLRRSTPTLADRYAGALLGLACGDALGTTVEFRPRGSFEPLTDMVGGGPFGLRAGQWTDDTAMALCLAESLVHCAGFDAGDQMRRYLRWRTDGYFSSTGACFDIGRTTSAALARFAADGEPFAGSTHPHTAGNGSLMRLAPVALFFHPHETQVVHYAGESSRTTHGAAEAVECCRLFAALISRCLRGADIERVLDARDLAFTEPAVRRLANGDYRAKTERQIKGSGYAVESLEAALWCFQSTRTFADAVLAAANLGDDADTTAAITGQIAGAFHGARAIPRAWSGRLHLRERIDELARQLLAAASARTRDGRSG